MGDNQLHEKDLTEKQRLWIEASRRIGPGPMTKSERTLLEQLYADMEPMEQQELYRYVQVTFGDKDKEKDGLAYEIMPEDPIDRMQDKMWYEPSGALKKALSSIQRTTPPRP